MNRKVRIIFSDEGYDTFTMGDEVIKFGDMADTVGEVAEELKKEGFDVSVTSLRGPREEGLKNFLNEIADARDHIIFNLCEGAFENSAYEMNVAALLELYGFRFTGSDSLTLGVALNKGLTKSILRGNGIPTPAYFVVSELPVSVGRDVEFPLIVKPLKEDASIGVDLDSVVSNIQELERRVEYILANYCQPAIVEEYVDGREFNISVIGNNSDTRALPPSEIDYSDFPEDMPKICCYEAKWITSSPLYIKSPAVCPARISDELRTKLQRTAVEVYRLIGCRDYARVDMRLDSKGDIRVLEVNPNPDISSDAGLARAAKSDGFEYSELLREIVVSAEKRYLNS